MAFTEKQIGSIADYLSSTLDIPLDPATAIAMDHTESEHTPPTSRLAFPDVAGQADVQIQLRGRTCARDEKLQTAADMVAFCYRGLFKYGSAIINAGPVLPHTNGDKEFYIAQFPTPQRYNDVETMLGRTPAKNCWQVVREKNRDEYSPAEWNDGFAHYTFKAADLQSSLAQHDCDVTEHGQQRLNTPAEIIATIAANAAAIDQDSDPVNRHARHSNFTKGMDLLDIFSVTLFEPIARIDHLENPHAVLPYIEQVIQSSPRARFQELYVPSDHLLRNWWHFQRIGIFETAASEAHMQADIARVSQQYIVHIAKLFQKLNAIRPLAIEPAIAKKQAATLAEIVERYSDAAVAA